MTSPLYTEDHTDETAEQLQGVLDEPRHPLRKLKFDGDEDHEARRQAKERRQQERRNARNARAEAETAKALADLGALLERGGATPTQPAPGNPGREPQRPATHPGLASHATTDGRLVPTAAKTSRSQPPAAQGSRPAGGRRRGGRGGRRGARSVSHASSWQETLAGATVTAMVRALAAESDKTDRQAARREAEANAARQLLPALAGVREQPWMTDVFAALEADDRERLSQGANGALPAAAGSDGRDSQAVLQALCFCRRYGTAAVRGARETGLVDDRYAEALEAVRSEAAALVAAGEARAVHDALQLIAQADAGRWQACRERLAEAIAGGSAREVAAAARAGRNQAERDAVALDGHDAESVRQVAVAFAVLNTRARLAVAAPRQPR